jgi:hypothetical protein
MYVINPQFDAANLFSEYELTEVRIGDEKTGKWGVIDKRGKFVVNPQYNDIASYSEGLASVLVGDSPSGKWGYIDGTGKMVINPQFDHATSFQSGLAIVRIGDDKNGKDGYIDKTGKYVINPQFDDARGFTKDGLARIRIGTKWGYISR